MVFLRPKMWRVGGDNNIIIYNDMYITLYTEYGPRATIQCTYIILYIGT